MLNVTDAIFQGVLLMPPKTPEPSSGDLFRMALENIIDQNHALVRLAGLINWARFDEAFGAFYDDQKGRAGLPTRLMAGLHLLKHMKGVSDEQVCAAWLENPYFQAFCGADYFQHELPFDRASMTRWRQRIGAKALVVRFRHLAPIAPCPRPNVGSARTTSARFTRGFVVGR